MRLAESIGIDVLLALLVLGVLFMPMARRPGRAPWSYRLAGFLVALAAVGIDVLLKHIEIWPSHPQFPSGNMTYSTALATYLVAWNRRWSVPVSAICVGQAVLLRIAHWHTVPELAGGVGLGVVIASVSLCLAWRHWRSIHENGSRRARLVA